MFLKRNFLKSEEIIIIYFGIKKQVILISLNKSEIYNFFFLIEKISFYKKYAKYICGLLMYT
jgi:hypothetical protein